MRGAAGQEELLTGFGSSPSAWCTEPPPPPAPEAAPSLCTKELGGCVHAYTGYILGHCFGGDVEPCFCCWSWGGGVEVD